MSNTLQSRRLRDPYLEKQARELRTKIREVSTQLFAKSASLGGSQETQFEQAFASLGYTYIRDKAPKLIDYLVGFQLVDRTEEETKAVGIFGFQVGNDWVYAPIFFLNGDIKGHEMLYLKRQDSFVPLKENWINYILSKQQHSLGRGVPRMPSRLGVGQPDLLSLSQPQMKMGAAAVTVFPNVSRMGWTDPMVPFRGVYAALTHGSVADCLQRGLRKHASFTPGKLLDVILENDARLCKLAAQIYLAYPLVKQAFDAWHGVGYFAKRLEGHKQKVKSAGSLSSSLEKTVIDYNLGLTDRPRRKRKKPLLPTNAEKVSVFDKVSADLSQFSDEDVTLLFRQGYLIRDKRAEEETSQAYATVETLALQNPEHTGVYEVLQKPGKFTKCLVLTSPFSCRKREGLHVVIDLESKAWTLTEPGVIFAKPSENSLLDYQNWFKDLADTSLREGGMYVIVTDTGASSVPFKAERKLADSKFTVWCRDYAYLHRSAQGNGPRYLDGHCPTGPDMVWQDARDGSQLRLSDGTLHMPKNAKLVELEAPPEPAATDSMGCCQPCVGTPEKEKDLFERALMPGNLLDLEMQVSEKSAGLKIYATPDSVSINGGPLVSKTAGLLSLVCDHGLRERAAKAMLKEAERRGLSGKPTRYRVRYAPEYPQKRAYSLMDQGQVAPAIPEDQMTGGFFGSNLPQYTSSQELLPAQGQYYADPSVYDVTQDPQNSIGVAQQASQMGQREIFDTAMLSGLIKSVRQDSSISKYAKDLMKALDRLGRIMFVFYWRNEYFSDRYGKADLPELEDSLRNSFEALGDVTLFLLEKDAEPLFGASNDDIGVDDAAQM